MKLEYNKDSNVGIAPFGYDPRSKLTITKRIMKLQLEAYKKKYTVETENDDLDIFEYLDIFKGLLVSAGFESNTVDSAIIELADTLKDDNWIDL